MATGISYIEPSQIVTITDSLRVAYDHLSEVQAAGQLGFALNLLTELGQPHGVLYKGNHTRPTFYSIS